MFFGKWGRSSGQAEHNSLPTVEEHEIQSLVTSTDDNGANGHATSNNNAAANIAEKQATHSKDKITCLDGLRGIACLLVFNYHFLWPWTAHIMLGHGAFPPRAPEPYTGWATLPIICLLHRGRPMVAIFFAISGYVLCRHVLKAIKERRVDVAYQKLASAVFRRAFRLYIPPMVTMLIVAILAQLGAFRSEDSIFKGPDSRWINGTVTFGYARRPCTNLTMALDTTTDMARYLHLREARYLLNVTGHGDVSEWDPVYHFCLNDTSKLFGPSSLYNMANQSEQRWWRIAMGMEKAPPASSTKLPTIETPKPHNGGEPPEKAAGPETQDGQEPVLHPFIPQYENWVWVQMGGSWEEHPIIFNRTIWAIGNYTRVMAEWANPFHFGHYHPRYDPHTFTIPMEFRGSYRGW